MKATTNSSCNMYIVWEVQSVEERNKQWQTSNWHCRICVVSWTQYHFSSKKHFLKEKIRLSGQAKNMDKLHPYFLTAHAAGLSTPSNWSLTLQPDNSGGAFWGRWSHHNWRQIKSHFPKASFFTDLFSILTRFIHHHRFIILKFWNSDRLWSPFTSVKWWSWLVIFHHTAYRITNSSMSCWRLAARGATPSRDD